MTGYNNATGEPRSIFTRFLPPTWRNIDSSKVVHNAIIGAIQDTLVDAESTLLDTKDESFLATASGIFLDKWGSYIGIARNSKESDEHYRLRIKQWIIKGKGTVKSLVTNIKLEFENENLGIFIYEPWRNIFTINNSVLNGKDYLQGNYYRFAVIDIHIGDNIDMNKLATIVDRYKNAGVTVYFTYETGLSIDFENYDITLVASSAVTSTTDDSLIGSVQTTFALGQPLSTATDADLFNTNDSHTNGADVLSGNPYRGKVTYNLAGVSNTAGSLANHFTNTEFTNNFDGWDITGNWTNYTKVTGYNGSNGIRLDASGLPSNDAGYKYFSRSGSTANKVMVPNGAAYASISLMGYIDSISTSTTAYVNSQVNAYDEQGNSLGAVLSAGNLLNKAILDTWQESNTRLLKFSLPSNTSYLDIQFYLRGQGNIIISQPMLTFDIPADTYLPATINNSSSSWLTSTTELADFSSSLVEYSDDIYIASNNKDGIVYPISGSDLTISYATLLSAVDSAITFTINTAQTTMSYTYDSSAVDPNLQYYVDIILSHTSFSLSNQTITRTTTTITLDDARASVAVNTVAGQLNYYIDNASKVHLLTLYSTTLRSKMIDFANLYTFSVDSTGALTYDHKVYTPTALSSAEVTEIYRVTSFTLSDTGILAYVANTTTMADINTIVNSVDLTLADTGLTMTTPNFVIASNNTTSIARDSFYVFNWDEYVKDNKTTLDIDNTFRYVKISTRGSEYGFNTNKVTVMTSTGVNVSDTANWIKAGSSTIDLDNGVALSYPTVSTNSYILDLGSNLDIASITLGDYYASPVRRTIEISKDNNIYDKVASVYSTGGDKILLSDYDTALDKGAWIANRKVANTLTLSAKQVSSPLEVSLYNFDTETWSTGTMLTANNDGVLITPEDNAISTTGLTIIRVVDALVSYDLDYLGFSIGWN